MPAYLKPITVKCVCGKPATVEVFNAMNAQLGRWCAACGAAYVKQLNAPAKGKGAK